MPVGRYIPGSRMKRGLRNSGANRTPIQKDFSALGNPQAAKNVGKLFLSVAADPGDT